MEKSKCNRGLNYPIEHLNNIKWLIVFSTRERQARYADNICRETINNPRFVKEQMDSITDTNDQDLFKRFNTTSVGNLAFVALHAPKPYSSKAEEILSNYKAYVEEGCKNL